MTSHSEQASTFACDPEAAALKNAIDQAEHVTVEFGTADTPLYTTQWLREFDQRNLYIGVNFDRLQHDHLQKTVASVAGHAVLSKLMGETLQPTPLPTECVDTVYMANVFGEPDSPHIMHRFQALAGSKQGRYQGNSGLDAKLSTVREAKRILKPAGQLVILETNTPYRSESHRQTPIKGMIELLADQGFTTATALTMRDPEWRQMVTQYAAVEQWWSFDSYLLIAQPAT